MNSALFLKYVLFLLFICISFTQKAQVTWANEVIEYSSQYGEIQYSASQVLGPPSVLPALENNVTAWSTRWPDKGEEFVKVKFPKSVYAQQVVIAETYNPGAVDAVILVSEKGNKRVVKATDLMPYYREGSGVLPLKVDPPFEANQLMLKMNTTNASGYNHIDAIGLSTSDSELKISLITSAQFDDVKPAPIRKTINSDKTELQPIPTADGKTLYFTRKDHTMNYGANDHDDIWVSHREGEYWLPSENAGAPINTTGHNHLNALSPDGKLAYCAGNINGNQENDILYTSTYGPTGWEKPVEIEIAGFYNESGYTSYHVSRDGKVMVLSLQRSDSRNSKDLYVSFKKEDGTWSTPQNLGTSINTIADEATPFISADGSTLYFSSKGFPGLGDFDIYSAKRLDDSWLKWSEPKNLGAPINSHFWDAYFSIADSSGDIFFARYVGNNNTDIFWVHKEEEKDPVPDSFLVNVIDATTRESIKAKIKYHQKIKASEIEDSTFTGDLDESTVIEVSADGYFSASARLTEQNLESRTITIELYPLEEGAVVPLQNIFFEANKSKLKPESFEELDNLAKFLKSHQEVKVEIAGHTNDLCSSSFCQKLSNNRARAVADYLKSKGVPKEQVSYKGYGKQQPIDTNETEAGRKKNQRVEVRVISVEE